MINKQVLPESFDFGMPSVELINVGSKGLDKTAMVKRASAFDDVLDKIEKKANRTYLHVITTGAFEKYGANANCFVGDTQVITEDGPVAIKDIKIGTNVLTKEGDYKPVIRKFMRGYTGILYTLGTKEGRATMTDNHPVFVVTNKKTKEGAFVEAQSVKNGDTVLISDGKGKCSKVTVEGAEAVSTSYVIVYNLEVEDSHTYCVPFVVHNCDAWNGASYDLDIPYPEDGKTHVVHLDGGLKKYHDDTYMKGGAVYQEHQTKTAGVDPSGEVVAACYNEPMQRGELLIAVDNDKWRDRLQKKASGKDIYLSIGASVPRDLCVLCGRSAKTASEHCDHFKHHRGELFDCGKVACVMNDSPSFYDISGVDVPADRIAFVLRKMASTDKVMAKTAAAEAIYTLGSRKPMLLTKAATILAKLAEMEKRIEGIVEGDKDIDLEAFKDSDDEKKDFILRVENYPADEVIDSCNRKGLLLSPGMLFRILGHDLEEGNALEKCDDSCCGDMSCMMRELEDDEEKNTELLDGSFDQHLPADLNLDEILNKFLPEFGTDDQAINAKIIRITISPRANKEQKKEAALNTQSEQALRKTYARYLISFAERNSDQACMNALMKIAALQK